MVALSREKRGESMSQPKISTAKPQSVVPILHIGRSFL
jgi:hypothetical protein